MQNAHKRYTGQRGAASRREVDTRHPSAVQTKQNGKWKQTRGTEETTEKNESDPRKEIHKTKLSLHTRQTMHMMVMLSSQILGILQSSQGHRDDRVKQNKQN